MALRTLIMGVVNVTPDSFSDGGRFLDSSAAIRHGLLLAQQGADIVDVGGESTRPGAHRVSRETEHERVAPVIAELVRSGVTVSVDTMNASTARLAADLGATYINDVSGGLSDEAMAHVASTSDAYFIASHWRAHSLEMDSAATYVDASQEITQELTLRARALVAAGVSPNRLILDPGLGFAKAQEHNWQVLDHLSDLGNVGYPILVGASRKRFLSSLLPPDATLEQRDIASAAVSLWAATTGAWGVRVHDVVATRRAFQLVEEGRLAPSPTGVGAEESASLMMRQLLDA